MSHKTVLTIIIMLVLLPISAQASSQTTGLGNSQREYSLLYRVDLPRYPYAFVSEEIVKKLCDRENLEPTRIKTEIISNNTLKNAKDILVYSSVYIILLNKTLYIRVNSTFLDNILNITTIGTMKIYHINYSVKKTHVFGSPNDIITVKHFEDRLICTGNISLQQTVTYKAGIIPVSSQLGWQGFYYLPLYTDPLAIGGNYSIIMVPPNNQGYQVEQICCDIFTNKRYYVGYDMNMLYYLLVISPPPGKQYDCCGIKFDPTETISTESPNRIRITDFEQSVKFQDKIINLLINHLNRSNEKIDYTKILETINIKGKTYNLSFIEFNVKSLLDNHTYNNLCKKKNLRFQITFPGSDILNITYSAVYGFLLEASIRSWVYGRAIVASLFGEGFIRAYGIGVPSHCRVIGMASSMNDTYTPVIKALSSESQFPQQINTTIIIRLVKLDLPPPPEETVKPREKNAPTILIALSLAVFGALLASSLRDLM